jgi:hypothetical protein
MVAQWLRYCATNRKVAGSIPDGVMEFFIDIILLIALWPWGRLSLWQKWVPGEFPGVKCSRCVGLTTLPPSCPVVMKSGNLNFLEPSWPLQACNGTALPLPLPYRSMVWGDHLRCCVAVYVVAGVMHKNNFHVMYLLIYRYDQLKRSKHCELFRNFVVIKFCCIKFCIHLLKLHNLLC